MASSKSRIAMREGGTRTGSSSPRADQRVEKKLIKQICTTLPTIQFPHVIEPAGAREEKVPVLMKGYCHDPAVCRRYECGYALCALF
jgi:hypothetical protein